MFVFSSKNYFLVKMTGRGFMMRWNYIKNVYRKRKRARGVVDFIGEKMINLNFFHRRSDYNKKDVAVK